MNSIDDSLACLIYKVVSTNWVFLPPIAINSKKIETSENPSSNKKNC